VAITGIAGNLGKALAKLLHTETRLVGIGRRPFLEAQGRRAPPARRAQKEGGGRLPAPPHRGPHHLGIMHDPRMPPPGHAFNVVGAEDAGPVRAQNVKKVVVLSSANVYGPLPGNPSFLPEETPLMASARFPEVGDLIEVDMVAQSFMWQHPDIQTVILRPVNIVGPTVRNAPSNFLRLERPLTVLGFDPMVQLIHEEDACRALRLALRPGARGVYNVVGPGEAPLSAVLRELGRRPVPIPHFLVRPLVKRLFESRLSSFPPGEVDHIQYLCAVDGSRAVRDLGWAPRFSLRETIRSVLGS
jgi:UDP-glucose 4-epimerase